MNKELFEDIKFGRCMILLGAGASYGSKNSKNNDLLMGEGLSEYLCERLNLPYQKGMLGKVFNIAKDSLGIEVKEILENNYKNSKPSVSLLRLAEHVFPRIYTLNIDDATENAFRKKSDQHVHVKVLNDPWNEIDLVYRSIDIVKLNGCVNRLGDCDLIFTPSEYAAHSINPSEWYKQLGRDFLNYRFVFIGTQLEEPLLFQQIEYYKEVWKSYGKPKESYLVIPEIDPITKKSLETYNIKHIPGTLEDFSKFLDEKFPSKRTFKDVALLRNPELALADEDGDRGVLDKIIKLTPSKKFTTDVDLGRTREFYLGFKPTWQDIYADVPAEMSYYEKFENDLNSAKAGSVFVLTGQAGSGKTTALMMMANKLSNSGKTVYYLTEPISNLKETLACLDRVNSGEYYFFFDRISHMADRVEEILAENSIHNAILVCAERSNVWRRKVDWLLNRYRPTIFSIERIEEMDAKNILLKLEKFGPWSRIAKFTHEERIAQLLEKSKRQLLIGLLELTYGYGFEKIIKDDFDKLPNEDSKLFLSLIGLATVHGLVISKDMCLAALNSAKIKRSFDNLLLDTTGIVTFYETSSTLKARHPLYIDKLFSGNISSEIKIKALRSFLDSIKRYEKPISKNMSRNELMLFKLTINHNFLLNFLNGDAGLALNLYKDYEKNFEQDGLYYLQYGLLLRQQNKHPAALTKLKSAKEAWAMSHTEHAYAQQLLICARDESKDKAFSNLNEAKEILLRLDAGVYEDETDYPIVTLAEHHVELIKKFDSASTKEVASYYISEISNRQRTRRSSRLEEARMELMKNITYKSPRNKRYVGKKG